MDKSKIAEALKEAHADFNAQTYDVVATNLANTGLVTDDNLQDIVSKSKTSLQATQAENDRRASKLSKEIDKLKSQLEQKQEPNEKPGEPKADEKKAEGNPEVDSLKQMLSELKGSIEGLYKERQQTSRRSQYESIYKDVKDEKFKANQLAKFDRMNFKDDDDFNSFLETETNDVKDFNQSQANEAMGSNPPMQGFSGKAKPSEAEINAIVDGMNF